MKYNLIYADPPWSYGDKRTEGKRKCGGAEVYYNTLSVEDIKNLPIKSIAADRCMLFLWCTFPQLQEGLDVIKAWGFTYKTVGFNWIKLNKKNMKPFFGMGAYTRSNSEICLIGVKGKPFRNSSSISSIHMSPIEHHSKKPDEIRDKIVELCGDLPRVELFARESVKGWDCLGDAIDNTDIRVSIKVLSEGDKDE